VIEEGIDRLPADGPGKEASITPGGWRGMGEKPTRQTVAGILSEKKHRSGKLGEANYHGH
jgi:hypothetical protein